MIIAILAVLGLVWGSFVNALTWRLHEVAELDKSKTKKPSKSKAKLTKRQLSIWNSRSMCPNCHHELAASDLVPLASWLALKGKCRYCKKPISWQYPLVEATAALIFVGSYIFWPLTLAGAMNLVIFGLWLALTVILVALAVYDLKWQLLPNKLVLVLALIALAQAVLVIINADNSLKSLLYHVIAVAIGGGLFYLIFAVSKGKWIGGGDVKLGLVLGLIVATPAKAFLTLFFAAVAGTVAALPLLASGRIKRTSAIAFGPFLILATILVVLFGQTIINWYVGLLTIGG